MVTKPVLSPKYPFLLAWTLDLFSKTYFTSIKTSRKILPLGKVMLFFSAAALFLIWDPAQTSMRYALTLSIGMMISSFLINLFRQPRSLIFTRILPDRVVEEAYFDYIIEVKNLGKYTSPALKCRDHGKLHFPSLADWARNKPPFDDELQAFDRFIGYPKWLWLVEILQDVIGFDFDIPPIPSGQSIQIQATGKAGKRGQRLFLGFYCGLPDPFGLFQRLFYVKAKQNILTLPKPLHCDILIPNGSRSRNAGDSRDLRKTGDSEEFRSLREWRSGDPLKRIDWKATARIGTPVTREFAPEYKLRTALAFDTTLPEGFDEQAFEDAMGYAAGMVVSTDRNDRNIDLLIVDNDIVSLRLGPGIQDHTLALERLASASPSSYHHSSLSSLENSILSVSSNFSSAVIICPSWTQEHYLFVERLVQKGLGIAVIVCSQPQAEFPLGCSFKILLPILP